MSHNTSQGWIKLHRCLLEHPLWVNSTPGQKVVLVTLLLLANHAEKQWEWQGRPYTCKPGQLITSLESLRKKCGKGISVKQLRLALHRLAVMHFAVIETTHRNTKITLCNWDTYQKENEMQDTEPGTKRAIEGNPEVIKGATNKNDKECKNERINISPQINPSFKKPTVEEINAYAQTQGFCIDSQYFRDYYESRGWMVGKVRMKDWQAAVRTWNRNQNTFNKPTPLPRVGKEVRNDGNYTTITA